MCDAAVTTVCLVSGILRNDVCAAMVSGVSKSLAQQGVTYQRLPITEQRIDWRVGDTGLLSVTLTEQDTGSLIDISLRDPAQPDIQPARLAGVAAFLCTMLNIRHVYWDGQNVALPAHGFLDAVLGQAANPGVGSRVFPRKVPVKPHSPAAAPVAARPPRETTETWIARAMRRRLTHTLDDTEIAALHEQERRNQSAPIRLSAWAMTFATAVLAAPLALPALVQNVVRGEDLRLACHVMGVSGLYSGLGFSGLLPGLPGIL